MSRAGRHHFNRLCSILVLGLAACSLSACVNDLPPDSKGGGAHLYLSPFAQNKVSLPLTWPKLLQLRYTMARSYLEKLRVLGIRKCFPALYELAYTQGSKVSNELFAEFYRDALDDLVVFEKQINALELRMRYVDRNIGCKPPYHNWPKVLKESPKIAHRYKK